MNLYEKMKSGVYVIAEMSANHAGKIENAFKIIEEAAKAGADCVKIQTYTADTLTIDCDDEPYRIKGGLWDGYNYYQLYQEAYTPWEWQQQLKDKCEEVGVDFLSTPFDRTAVDFLEGIGIEFYKIASFELVDIPLIEYTAGKGKPMIMSCGMASEEEIAEALDAGIHVRDITFIAGTVYKTRMLDEAVDTIVLPSYEKLKEDKLWYARSFYTQYCNTDAFAGKRLAEPYGEHLYIVQNPAAKPLTQMEMDDVYALP